MAVTYDKLINKVLMHKHKGADIPDAVPYIGATQDVDLGANNITLGGFIVDPGGTGGAEITANGRLLTITEDDGATEVDLDATGLTGTRTQAFPDKDGTFAMDGDALRLDQTTPQTVNNGSPVFAQGLTIAANQRVYLDG